MAEHHVSVTVRAPVRQVYTLFTHFNDFPKFMRFVKEVTYYDDQRSHWVVQVGGRHEWDAVNEGWISDQQIGWRSIDGLQNTGRVKFTPVDTGQTMVDVFLNYTPPAGVLGVAVEKLGMDSHFQSVLEEDIQHFARMVEEAPPGALDPMSSHYLFHEGRAWRSHQPPGRIHGARSNDDRRAPPGARHNHRPAAGRVL
ncbi:SRPBCC family protein [Ktedonobacter racemifer]|uniref:SRPBCC family protein n=1 Tax=Ktedonobacter racemifer TaxID=363277 RepID=UPI0006986C04|nr:SRPBCC family protein [Ktedonobacter racemifer]